MMDWLEFRDSVCRKSDGGVGCLACSERNTAGRGADSCKKYGPAFGQASVAPEPAPKEDKPAAPVPIVKPEPEPAPKGQQPVGGWIEIPEGVQMAASVGGGENPDNRFCSGLDYGRCRVCRHYIRGAARWCAEYNHQFHGEPEADADLQAARAGANRIAAMFENEGVDIASLSITPVGQPVPPTDGVRIVFVPESKKEKTPQPEPQGERFNPQHVAPLTAEDFPDFTEFCTEYPDCDGCPDYDGSLSAWCRRAERLYPGRYAWFAKGGIEWLPGKQFCPNVCTAACYRCPDFKPAKVCWCLRWNRSAHGCERVEIYTGDSRQPFEKGQFYNTDALFKE